MPWLSTSAGFAVLEPRGSHSAAHQRTGQAMGPLRGVSCIYEGTLNARPGGYVIVPSPQPTEQLPSAPAVIVSASEVKTLLAALDEAAEYKRDRAETCIDCVDQSCTTCQSRLQAADAYNQL